MSIELIKKLREETGLSFTVIKEAVNKHEDIDSMRAYLQALRMENTHDQVAKKGRVVVSVKDDIGLLFEVNAMTDFVSSHKAFNAFIHTLETVLLNHPMTPFDDIFILPFEDTTVSDARIKLETRIGEHVKITRVSYVKKTENQVFGLYQHHNFRSASLIVLEKLNIDAHDYESCSKVIATHVASMGVLTPKWKQTVIDQILQSTLHDKEQTVKNYLLEQKFNLVYASRFELGETMEEHLSCSLLKKEACSS
jgi:elongation factor Ts